MAFLADECKERGATIVYATHIFDGLESWPTHVAYVARGEREAGSRGFGMGRGGVTTGGQPSFRSRTLLMGWRAGLRMWLAWSGGERGAGLLTPYTPSPCHLELLKPAAGIPQPSRPAPPLSHFSFRQILSQGASNS